VQLSCLYSGNLSLIRHVRTQWWSDSAQKQLVRMPWRSWAAAFGASSVSCASVQPPLQHQRALLILLARKAVSQASWMLGRSTAAMVFLLRAMTSGRQLRLARGRRERLCLRIADLLKPPTAEYSLHHFACCSRQQSTVLTLELSLEKVQASVTGLL